MPVPKGTRVGGRKPGTPNKATRDVQEILERLGVNPFAGMATIAANQLPCGVCRGKGKTAYKLADGSHAKDCAITEARLIKGKLKCTCNGVGQRVCESCYGTLFEACSPELRGKMHAELAQYVAPKRKAVEHSGPDGAEIPLGIRVISVRADRPN